MNLKEILTIPGKRGLYKLVSRGKNNFVIESLMDHSRMLLYASHQASALNDICIFANGEEIHLQEIFKRISLANDNGLVAENKIKDVTELKKLMGEILPEYDKDKVHVSDMKKLFLWYNILYESNLLSFDEATTDNETDTEIKNDDTKTDSEN
jgi:hypothetical protein